MSRAIEPLAKPRNRRSAPSWSAVNCGGS